MIESVTREGAVFAEAPHKFEAGTVNAAGAAGLHAGAQQQGRSEQQRDLLFHIRNLFPAR